MIFARIVLARVLLVLLCSMALLGLFGGGQDAALARASLGNTFSCRTYGYSIPVPDGWYIKDRNCTKRVTNVLESTVHDAIIGVEIVAVNTLGLGFQQVITQELSKLGIPASAITFGWQHSGSIRYDMAVYSPTSHSAGPGLTAYIVGTEQNGITYAFEGYIITSNPAAVTALATQLRDIYDTIHFFKGSSPLLRRTVVTPPQRPVTADASGQVVGFAVLVGVVALALAAAYFLFLRRESLRTA